MTTFGAFDDKSAFRAWIAAHEPGAIIGVAMYPRVCPLSKRARALGIRDASVADGALTYVDAESDVPRCDPLRTWQRLFYEKLDNMAVRRHNYDCTREDCLRVLDSIPEDMR